MRPGWHLDVGAESGDTLIRHLILVLERVEREGSMAEQRGDLVLSGRASELESDLPYWVFVHALDDHLRSLGGGHELRTPGQS
jgi:hypothetical protein